MYSFRDIARCWSKIAYFYLFAASVGVTQLEFHHVCGVRKRQSIGYHYI